MIKELSRQFKAAEGRSELIIAVFCDIREFTKFSGLRQAPDIAMFIKRFYTKLLDRYFQTAIFAKPTGDGLLLIFKYSEKDIHEVAKRVLNSCFKAIKDFPAMFKNDPMINFPTPVDLGFGIARGTACCLFAKSRILDYSGQVLNLAARLKDLSHPRGIIIDGGFQLAVLTEELKAKFKSRRAYIRSIAEETPHEILCSDEVKLPSHALVPLMSTDWKSIKKEFKLGEAKTIRANFSMRFPDEVVAQEYSKLNLIYDNTSLPGTLKQKPIENYEFYIDAEGNHLRFSMVQALALIADENLSDESKLVFELHYIPKPKLKKEKRKP